MGVGCWVTSIRSRITHHPGPNTHHPSRPKGVAPMPAVLYERFESVAVITLNRPEALNSLNQELTEDLYASWERFMEEEDALVAVLTGAGRAFCAGMDMKAAAE